MRGRTFPTTNASHHITPASYAVDAGHHHHNRSARAGGAGAGHENIRDAGDRAAAEPRGEAATQVVRGHRGALHLEKRQPDTPSGAAAHCCLGDARTAEEKKKQSEQQRAWRGARGAAGTPNCSGGTEL